MATAGLTSRPAHAYSVMLNGRTAGNPAQPLYDIGINSGDIGRTLDPITWFLPANGTNPSVDLSAKLLLTIVNFTTTQITLGFELYNLTDISGKPLDYKAHILGLGFGVTPDVTSATFNQDGDLFDDLIVQGDRNYNGNFPGGFKNIDVCIYAANNCSGGSVNQGLAPGMYDVFEVAINGNFANREATLHDMGLKFQTQDESYQLAGVPEPMTMLGSGMALGFGALMKRQAGRRKQRNQEKVTA